MNAKKYVNKEKRKSSRIQSGAFFLNSGSVNFYNVKYTVLQNSLHGFQHAFCLDEVEIFLDLCSETFNLVEVFVPDACSSENTLCNHQCIACGPEILEQVHDFRCIIRYNLCTVFTLTTFIIGDDSCKSEYKSLRQLTLALQIGLQSWKITCTELRE